MQMFSAVHLPGYSSGSLEMHEVMLLYLLRKAYPLDIEEFQLWNLEITLPAVCQVLP